MSIRVRLAIWYGGLFGLILLLTGLLAYGFHARSLYGDVDRALTTSTGHVAAEVASSQRDPVLVEGHGGFEVILALYSPDGVLRKSSAETGALPLFNPQAALRAPAGPAYGGLVDLVPPISAFASNSSGGAFAIVTTHAQRWRIYVLPLHHSGVLSGYVAALTPLGAADASMRAFGALLLGLEVGGLATAVAGSWIVSSKALHPVVQMSEMASNIAHSRDLSHRIDVPRHHDEICRLARTFNAMLASIEDAYIAQQRFVSDASHELRAPLTAIQANLDLLQCHPEMTRADRAEALTEAERESTRLTRLVADLLALARADAGISLRSSIVDLDAIVLDVFGSARQLARGQALTLEPFEPIQIWGDEDRLKQLLLILLDNALKYTPPDGTVAVGLRRDVDEAEVVVRDTGVGISERDLPHVFERFYRADPARGRDPGGTGLGLPIADWIVRQHGGHIDIASHAGKGTTVAVRLPVAGVRQAIEPATALRRIDC